MEDILSRLYYGEICPHVRSYSEDSTEGELSKTLSDSEKWLTEHLEGPAKSTLLNLVNAQNEIEGYTAYESFRRGFLLGARLIMAVCCDQEEK